MPSTAVIAGGVAAVLVCAGLGIGLGVGLTRDDNDSPPSGIPDPGVNQEAGAAGASGDAAVGAPLAPRGPADMFPGTAPAAIAPMPEPMLAPAEAPAAAPVVVAVAPVPEVAPAVAPEVAPGVAPVEAFVPMDGPGPAPMEMPELAPEEAPEVAPVLAPEEVPEEAPEEAPVEVPVEAPVPEVVPVAVAPAPEPVPAPVPVDPPVGTFVDKALPGPDGKYPVCVNGDSEEWGLWDIFRPCGIRVFADGRVELAEWFGGFDGYPAVDPADGHETCFNTAVAEMFRIPYCDFSRTTDGVDEDGKEVKALECEENADGSQCVCAADEKIPSLKSQRNWPGNQGVITFLTTMRERADPVNYDFPQDEEIADAGGRMDNVVLVQAVFQDMITVSQC